MDAFRGPPTRKAKGICPVRVQASDAMDGSQMEHGCGHEPG